MTCPYPSEMAYSGGHRFPSGKGPHHSNYGPPPTNFGFRPRFQNQNGRPEFRFGKGPHNMGVHRFDNPPSRPNDRNRIQNNGPEIQRFTNNSPYNGSPECYNRHAPQPKPHFRRSQPRFMGDYDRPNVNLDNNARGLDLGWDQQRHPCHNVNRNEDMTCNFVTRPSNHSGPDGKSNPFVNRKRKENGKGYQDRNLNIKHPKKQKIDKRDLPENNKFSCDTCDRGFQTKEKYTEHVLGHEHCRVDGCPYVAAPKLVKLHYTMQHTSGMARKIWGTETDADIQKWIQERKRNYPTEKNIAKKQTVLEEKHARGEVLETKEFGRLSNSRRNRRGRRHHMAEQHTQPDVEKAHVEIQKSTTDKQDTMSSVTMKNEKVVSGSPTKTKNQIETSDIIDSSNKETFAASCAENSEPHSVTKKSFNGDDSTASKDHADTSPKVDGNSLFRKKSRPGRKHVPTVSRRPPTLLQKLLAADIRHERNVILQCVRYAVQQHFFDPNMAKSQPSTQVTSQPSTGDITSQPLTGNITVIRGEVDSSSGVKCPVNVGVTTEEIINKTVDQLIAGESSETSSDDDKDVIEGGRLPAHDTSNSSDQKQTWQNNSVDIVNSQI